MRQSIAAVLVCLATTPDCLAQDYAGADAVDVRLSVDVRRGKNGDAPWDLGPGAVPLPDIAFCVDVPGKMRWCTPGFAIDAAGRIVQAKPHCRDKRSCEAIVAMPKGAAFRMIIFDIDLRFHDKIGEATCDGTKVTCTVGAAEVGVLMLGPAFSCSTANANYEANTGVVEAWGRQAQQHVERLALWRREGERRLAEFERNFIQIISDSVVPDYPNDRAAVREAKWVLTEVRNGLLQRAGGKPLSLEAKRELRQLLESTLNRAAMVAGLENLQKVARLLPPARWAELVYKMYQVLDAGWPVLESWVANFHNASISRLLAGQNQHVRQRATYLTDEGRRRGCPISARLVETFNRAMAAWPSTP